MISYLLDTNQLLRVADRPDRLTAAAAEALAGAAMLYVSAVSAWEIEIKRSKFHKSGEPKLEVEGPTASLVRYVAERGGEVLPLTVQHATTSLQVPCPVTDPFDEVLLKQCQSERLRLLTSDGDLRRHPLVDYVG